MKIAVKDLKPNPFRRIRKYPIDKEKVKSLKISINETSFWDNILARKNNGQFEIAYGHHRLIALKELKIKTVDIPVKEIDNATMIRIMANENMETWSTAPKVVNETILVAKEYLDKELAKANSLEYLGKTARLLFKGVKGDFEKAKQMGVGRDTILKFLGGNWKGWMVKEALAVIKDEAIVDRKAVEEFPALDPAKNFRKAVKDYKVPKKHQRKLAKELVKAKVGTREIAREVRKEAKKIRKLKVDPLVNRLEKDWTEIEKQATALRRKIEGFMIDLRDLDIQQLAGIRTLLGVFSFKRLIDVIMKLSKYAGVKQIKGEK